MAKLKRIVVPHGYVKIIQERTGASDKTVRDALRGITQTDYAMMIRKKANDILKTIC